ncbi:MAG: DUF4180 domain-containing protein [Chlorobiaceae bacterium]|nr:DUF4180 domain-containing protein [Chlorobiaceae bacterium]
MAIHYTTKIEEDVLHVLASGFDLSPSDVEEYASRLLKICLDNGIQRVLCDESAVTTELSALDTYEIGLFISKFVPTSLRIAIVFRPETSFDVRFFESIVVNRGQQIRVFTDAFSARTWLDGL